MNLWLIKAVCRNHFVNITNPKTLSVEKANMLQKCGQAETTAKGTLLTYRKILVFFLFMDISPILKWSRHLSSNFPIVLATFLRSYRIPHSRPICWKQGGGNEIWVPRYILSVHICAFWIALFTVLYPTGTSTDDYRIISIFSRALRLFPMQKMWEVC